MAKNILAKIGVVFSSALVLLFTLTSFSQADENYEFWPGAQYDPAIPTYNEVLGYHPGDKITSYGEMIRFFEALAKAAPDRIKITQYATTWEGRKLIYAAISNPENIAALPALSQGMKQLADPANTNQATADQLINSLPSSVWLSYAVHGNEISSTDAAMMTAYHLLASKNNAQVDKIMNNVVTFIDPLQNPDGRDRFVHHYTTSRGLLPDSSRLSVEQNEAWPGGRTNHYLFDMNRDWFALTQPETIGRIKALQEWYPLVFVDLHEMGGNDSYYFAPEAIPYNPHLAMDQRNSLELFGKNNAKWFDEFGFDYFTREIFDAFYPGYGASWPSYYGAIAMTYEQGSSRGLVFHRNDGEDLHYRDTVRHHFVSSLSTAETAATNRVKFLRDFYNYRKSAIAEGRKEKIKSYIIPTQYDQAAATKLAGLLVSQGVEVKRADKDFKACNINYAAGSYVINMAQPAKRLIRTLMDKNVDMEKDFLVEQERRRAKDIRHQIYDVTGWSLPLMYNITNNSCDKAVKDDFPLASASLFNPATLQNPDAKVAFLVPWGQAPSARLLSQALRHGLTVKSNDKAFTSQGRDFPSGSLIFEVKTNPANLSETLAKLAENTGAEVFGVNDSWITAGPNFGSGNVVRINAPRVAMAWDNPTSSSSAGNTKFVIERQFDYPVTTIRTAQLSRANLSRFQVLILPNSWGSYQSILGKNGTENLKNWISRGGTLIAMGSAMRYVSDPKVNLMSTRREDEYRATETKGATADKDAGNVKGTLLTSPEDLVAASTPLRENPDSIPGILANVTVDPEHWLAAGLADQLNVLVRGGDIYSPIRLNNGANVISFNGADDVLASGYLWEENRKQLAYKPFLMIQPRGRGHVIGFTQEPTTRAYLDGLNLVLMNAIFRGSAHSTPLR